MNRVLSYPQSHSCDGPAEAVSKRFCFSCIFSVSFISLILGYMLGNRSSNVNVIYVTNLDYMTMLRETSFNVRSRIESTSSMNYTDQISRLQAHFTLNNFDSVSPLITSNVVLTFQNNQIPDTLEIVTDNGVIREYFLRNVTHSTFKMPHKIDELEQLNNSVIGTPIYCNFGTKEDLNYLEEKGIVFHNHVTLLRLGKIAVSEKVYNVLKRGVKGILLYMDSESDCSSVQNEIHPVLLTQMLKPQGSSKCYSPNCGIAIQFIDAQTAKKIIEDMDTTNISPNSWQGSLATLYSFGPGFLNKTYKIRMRCHFVVVRYVAREIAAYLRGRLEPDRYVVVAGSRNSLFNFEDADDSTEALIEISKVLAQLKNKKHWIPTRTLIFISFALDGLELFPDSYIGRHADIFMQRTAVFLRIRQPRSGFQLDSGSTQVMNNLLVNIITSSQKSSEKNKLGYVDTHTEFWEMKSNVDDLDRTICLNELENPSWSKCLLQEKDYMKSSSEIFSYFGIPAVSFSHSNEKNNLALDGVNENYEAHIIQVWTMLIYSLASDIILPFNFTVYTPIMRDYQKNISRHGELLKNFSLSEEFEIFSESITQVLSVLPKFHRDISLPTSKNDNAVNRIINDKFILMHKLFLCSLNTLDILMRIVTHHLIPLEENIMNNFLKKGIYCSKQIEYLTENI